MAGENRRKEGVFNYNEISYAIVELPGAYSLSANSEEEIVTRDYIAGNKADLICFLADASQLERSLFMLADYAGINKPVVLLLNMMDVATQQGKAIDCQGISKKLGIPVLPMIASDQKCYDGFYKMIEKSLKSPSALNEKELTGICVETIGEPFKQLIELLPKEGMGAFSTSWLAEKLLEQDEQAIKLVKYKVGAGCWNRIDAVISGVKNGNLLTADCKFKWIKTILVNNVKKPLNKQARMNRFDQIATNLNLGKGIALGVIILGMVASMAFGDLFMSIFGVVQQFITTTFCSGLTAIGAPAILVSFVCGAFITGIFFSFMMAAYVFGTCLVFGFIEEVGYMAPISFVFDNAMQKLGLHGKAIMPFLVSFGCTIAGVSGTRVIDSWKQRLLATATCRVIPCSATYLTNRSRNATETLFHCFSRCDPV